MLKNDMKNLYFATTNNNKIQEVTDILNLYFPYTFMVQGIKPKEMEPEEDASTFEENAEIKCSFYSNENNILDGTLIAEDSGFTIPALNDFPSVHSARFLRKFPTKLEGFLELQSMLAEKKVDFQESKVQAKFICSFCTKIGNEFMKFSSTIDGIISFDDMEYEGFGYDPIFIPSGHNTTFARMLSSDKNRISHRSQALRKLVDYIL